MPPPGDELTSLSPSFEAVGACSFSAYVSGGPGSVSWGERACQLFYFKGVKTYSCYRTEFVHSALGGPNAKHRELPLRKVGCFIMNGASRENRKLMLKKPELPDPGFGSGFQGARATGCRSAGGTSFGWRTLELGHLW